MLKQLSRTGFFQKLKFETICRATLSTNGSNEPPSIHEVLAARSKREYDREVTVYVHWPYCKKHCTYCSFNKYVKSNVDIKRLSKCLVRELKTLLRVAGAQTVRSVFFGGGTPSLAPPDTIFSVLDMASKAAYVASDTEISLEANPTSMTIGKLKDFKSAGVNRLSVGMQSLNDASLNVLGREHNVDEATRFLAQAKHVFSGRTSADIIFGCPGQTLKGLVDELSQLIDISDSHISLYQLTLKPGTKLYQQVKKGVITIPDDDLLADMYEYSVGMLTTAGFKQYEVSNFARHYGAQSVHNMAYWEGRQYLGVGPGAHGRFTPRGEGKTQPEIWINIPEPDRWMTQVEMTGQGARKVIRQTHVDVLQELLALGMRTLEGVPNRRWLMSSRGYSLKDVFSSTPQMKDFVDGEFLEFTESYIRPTNSGMQVLDSLLPPLLLQIQSFFETKNSSS